MSSSAPAFVAAGPSVFAKRAPLPAAATCSSARPSTAPITMGGKNAKFGPFTPAVVAAKLVLGDKSLNKLRGQAIKMHTQTISKFCEATGYDNKTRSTLIRLAKNNGDTLGFLY